MIIAFEFDDVVVKSRYPKIGKVHEESLRMLKHLVELGHTLILYTRREDYGSGHNYLSSAVNYIKSQGLYNFHINTLPPHLDPRPKMKPKAKVWADYYVERVSELESVYNLLTEEE